MRELKLELSNIDQENFELEHEISDVRRRKQLQQQRMP